MKATAELETESLIQLKLFRCLKIVPFLADHDSPSYCIAIMISLAGIDHLLGD